MTNASCNLLQESAAQSSVLWRQLQGSHAVCESRRPWRLEACCIFLREGSVHFRKGLEATPELPRRVRESRLSWCRIRAAPLSGGSVTNPGAGGNFSTSPTSCAGVTPVVAPGWTLPSLGRAVRIRKLWSLLRSSHELRESNDCACRGLVACCNLFGGCRMAPKHWTHLLCCHAPCESAIATSVCAPRLSREEAVREPRERRYVDPASFGR